MNNMWERLIKYLNNKKIKTIINTQTVKQFLNCDKSQTKTLYQYILILMKIEILIRVSRGRYQINYHIKKDLKSSEAKDAAYNNTYKSWFNDFKVFK